MEAVKLKAVNLELGLREKGVISSFVVVVGYYREEDFNKGLAKLILPKDEIIERI